MSRFTHAIVREVSDTFSSGITTIKSGIPDVKEARKQHKKYCEVLETNGIELIKLSKLNVFPDSVFVEDTAIKVGNAFVIGRSGVASRLGENKDVIDVLGERFDLEFITFPGTVEGGDILRISDHFFIGLSSRTNYEGIMQFINILDKKKFTYSIIPVRDVLHLKTGASLITDDNEWLHYVLSIYEFRKFFIAFDYEWSITYNYIPHIVEKKESYAANVLSLNGGTVLVPKGFPDVTKLLKGDIDANVVEIDMSEFQKMDGSLTCLSILF